MSRVISIASLTVAVCGVGVATLASEPDGGDTQRAYRLTLQILGGMSSCSDEWGGPEYYATASRRDPDVENELEGVEKELARLKSRVEAFDERMEPLLPREHNNVPLTEVERQELEELRERSEEILQTIKQKDPMPFEERRMLERERSEINRSVTRLENSIPLTDEEARFLRDQKAQRAPLNARKKVLEKREANLTSKISMKTPGSLRVYQNDILTLRLMEDDAFVDDTCATWPLTLDREALNQGGTDLKHGDRPLLRLWVQPDPSSIEGEESR